MDACTFIMLLSLLHVYDCALGCADSPSSAGQLQCVTELASRSMAQLNAICEMLVKANKQKGMDHQWCVAFHRWHVQLCNRSYTVARRMRWSVGVYIYVCASGRL